jgi:hypothetical protein
MPRGDGTGPAGMGSLTGRRAGFCAGYDAPGYANPVGGRGYGGWWGRGGAWGGRGWRHTYYATGLPGWARAGIGPAYGFSSAPAWSKEQEMEALRTQAEYMKESLDNINQRLQELEKEE